MGDDTKENVNLNSTDARDSELSQTKQVTPFRHAIHDLNSEFLFTPMDRYFSLVDLLHAIVQHFYHNLYVLADLLSDKDDDERKTEITRFKINAIQMLLRLDAVLRWLRKSNCVFASNQVYNFINRKISTLIYTADRLFTFARLNLPINTLGAFDVIRTSALLSSDDEFLIQIPYVIKNLYCNIPKINDADLREALDFINVNTRHKLAISEITDKDVKFCLLDGHVIISCRHYFKVDLTILNPTTSWHIVSIQLLIPGKSRSKTLIYKQHLILRDRMQLVIDLCDNPIQSLISELKSFCISIRLQRMLRKFSVDIQQRHVESLVSVSNFVPGSSITLNYYQRNSKSEWIYHVGLRTVAVRKMCVRKLEGPNGVYLVVEHLPKISISATNEINSMIEDPNIDLYDLLTATIKYHVDHDFQYLKFCLCHNIKDVIQYKDPPRLLLDSRIWPGLLCILPEPHSPKYTLYSSYHKDIRGRCDQSLIYQVAQTNEYLSDENSDQSCLFYSRYLAMIKSCRSVLHGHGFLSISLKQKKAFQKLKQFTSQRILIRKHHQWRNLYFVIHFPKSESLLLNLFLFIDESKYQSDNFDSYSCEEYTILLKCNLLGYQHFCKDSLEFQRYISLKLSKIETEWPLYVAHCQLRELYKEQHLVSSVQGCQIIIPANDYLDLSLRRQDEDGNFDTIIAQTVQYVFADYHSKHQCPLILWTFEVTIKVPALLDKAIKLKTQSFGLRQTFTSRYPSPAKLTTILYNTQKTILSSFDFIYELVFLQTRKMSCLDIRLLNFTGDRVGLGYGPNFDFAGYIFFNSEGKKTLVFPCCRNRVLNPHNMMAKVLEKYVFGTSGNSVVVLAKTLNRTIMPAFSIQDIPSNLRGPAFTLTENIRGTFLINFETPLHWIISWGSQIFLKLDFSLDNNAIQISDMTQSICELLKTELNCLSLFEMAKTYLLSWTGYGLNPQPSVVNSMNPISMQTSQDTRITQEYEMRPRSVHPGYYVNTGQLFSQQIYPQAALQSSPRLMQDQSRFQSHRLPSPFSNTSHQQQMTNQALVGENFPKRAFDEGSSIPTSPAVAPDSKPRSNIGIRQTPTQGPWWFTDFIPNVSAIDSVKSKMPMPADHLPPFFISTKTLFIFFTSYGIKYRTQNVLINRLFSSIHLVNKMTALFKLYAAKGLINSRLAISNDREILVYRCTKVPLDFTFVFDPHLPGFLVHLMQNNESSPSIFNFDELQVFERYINSVVMVYPSRPNVAVSFISLLLTSHPSVIKDIYNLFKFEMTSGMPWKVRWHTSVPMGFGLKPFTPSFICIHQKAFMFIRLYLRLQRADNQGLTTSRCFMLPISYDLTTGCIEISALQCPTSNDDVIAAINFISSNLTEYSKNHARSSGSPAAVLFLTLRDLVCRLPVTFGAGSEELFQMSQSQIFQRSPNLQLMSPTQRIMSPTHRLPTGELVYRQISPQYTTRMEYQAQMGRHPIETNVSRPPQLINRPQGRGRS